MRTVLFADWLSGVRSDGCRFTLLDGMLRPVFVPPALECPHVDVDRQRVDHEARELIEPAYRGRDGKRDTNMGYRSHLRRKKE